MLFLHPVLKFAKSLSEGTETGPRMYSLTSQFMYQLMMAMYCQTLLILRGGAT